MIEGGEDPRFIMRRILIAASEDVGLADPVPLMLASSASQALEAVGLPEGRYFLAHAALTVCLALKSNSVTKGINSALAAVRKGDGRHPVPLHLHGALGPGEKAPQDYRYPHDFPGHHVSQQYLPDEVTSARFYEATGQGREAAIQKLLRQWERSGQPGDKDDYKPGHEPDLEPGE
jgi:putative ATPase